MSGLTFEEFSRTRNRALERIFRLGAPPPLEDLAGWEFCGMNRPAVYALVGIRKFVKGFFVTEAAAPGAKERIEGFNIAAIQNGISGEWLAKGDDLRPSRFGFYTVEPTRAGRRGEQYPNAILLDYGASPRNPGWSPVRLIRDLLVQVEPGSSDVLLGKALLALAPGVWVFSNYFLLRRRRSHDYRG